MRIRLITFLFLLRSNDNQMVLKRVSASYSFLKIPQNRFHQPTSVRTINLVLI